MKLQNQYNVKINSIKKITHDVLSIVTERPLNYNFTPGQATEISINRIGWKNDKRPFTFTSLPNNNYLEFTIKTYPLHLGFTNQLLQLKIDDELILHDIFGAIHYKGKGTFIAGGAGVTPFISIFRYLKSINEVSKNKLIFANKTKADIIIENELQNILKENFINILSDEKVNGYLNGQIDTDVITQNNCGFDKYFYLCGPPKMMESIEKYLSNLQIPEKLIIKEIF